jgi:hypothetical protein
VTVNEAAATMVLIRALFDPHIGLFSMGEGVPTERDLRAAAGFLRNGAERALKRAEKELDEGFLSRDQLQNARLRREAS